MAVVVSDDLLREAGLDEGEARLELACRLFDVGRLTLHSAARLAGMERTPFEQELLARGITLYRPTVQDLHDDLAALDRAGV